MEVDQGALAALLREGHACYRHYHNLDPVLASRRRDPHLLIRKVTAIFALLVVLLTATAAADPEQPVPTLPPPFLRMRLPAKICWPDLSTCADVEAGYYIEEHLYNELDVEMRRLQDQETRLGAENKSLRSSADAFPWLPVAIGVGVGFVAGVYLGTKL